MNTSKEPEILETKHDSATPEKRWGGHMADDVSATYGPEPMAFLSATGDELLLSGTRGTYRIPLTSVKKIGRGGMYPWFFSAVRIYHTMAEYPKELQFKPLGLSQRDVVEQLKALGYPVR